MTRTSDMLRGLVEFLYINTAANKIDWEISPIQGEVWAEIGGYRVEITEEPSNGFEQDIRITLFNASGDQVDTFSDNYFGRSTPQKVELNSYFSVMSTLLEMAKRQANGADAAIESILSTLGGGPISDPPKPGEFAHDLDDDVPF